MLEPRSARISARVKTRPFSFTGKTPRRERRLFGVSVSRSARLCLALPGAQGRLRGRPDGQCPRGAVFPSRSFLWSQCGGQVLPVQGEKFSFLSQCD